MWIGIATLLGFAVLFILLQLPAQFRKKVIAGVTFVCGLFYVLLWLWPQPQDYTQGELPNGFVEAVGFKLQDSVGEVGNIATVLTSFLLGLGAISLLRIHVGRLIKLQKDWFFSLVTLASMFIMMITGYVAWTTEKFSPNRDIDFSARENWNWALWSRDFMFDGLLQKMDAAMFSIIAFYIISAAYRAFRIRSVESTILLAAALIMMLSLLPMAEFASAQIVNGATGGDPNNFLENFKLAEVGGFVRQAFQAPSIRGIDFGIGIGALAMGLRLWLSLDRQTVGGGS